MGKDNDTESSKKKKQASNSTSTTPVKEEDIYKTIITCEEKEAIERDPEKDSESFLSVCDFVRKSLKTIAALKSNANEKTKEEVSELQIQTALAFIELKKLNRMEKFRTQVARDSLNNAKSSVDSRHLQLQNLLYEVMHLKKEVVKCLQFKSKDEAIQLVSEHEFFQEAPESISRPEITKNDPHQLRLARLEWELTQRKQLALSCDELTESKKSVAASIASKQSRLDNLDPQLRTILEASKPLQESLGLPLDKVREEHKKATSLSAPLYVLYAKAKAYQDAYDSSLIISVEGDEDDAKLVNNQEGIQESDSDAENQGDGVVEEPPVHKKRHHRLSKEARLEEKKSKLLQKHPLSVKIVLSFKGNIQLVLEFFYLIVLKVVTVESKLDAADLGGISSSDMLVSESVLRELFPKDTGTESPNPANHYQLSKFKLGSFSSLGLGIPYKWAQRMAGLHFVLSETSSDRKLVDQELAQHNVESVLREMKRRVRARLELCMEIRQLESGNLPIFTDNIMPMPRKVSTSLEKFSTITWRSYNNHPETPMVCQQGLICSTDIFYEAILRRGSCELVARIAIKPDYPKVTPIFSISVGSSVQLTNSDVLRDMEREVNVMWDKPPTLSAQLQRLRACFDIFLETEGMAPKDKIYFHPVKGKARFRPYKYVAQGGIFTHR